MLPEGDSQRKEDLSGVNLCGVLGSTSSFGGVGHEALARLSTAGCSFNFAGYPYSIKVCVNNI
jgi:hypothetical protein